jgi:hypothetical protein
MLIQIKVAGRNEAMLCVLSKEAAMPVETIVIVGLISAVFIGFALVLAWASRQTRVLPTASETRH